MKVCTHQGLQMAVLTRNEHCPPHVHVGSVDWEARFEFSFWHNGVRLWDVVPVKNKLVAKFSGRVFGQPDVGRAGARGDVTTR
jgi:hypothetical protein